jgi:hypothetical protein
MHHELQKNVLEYIKFDKDGHSFTWPVSYLLCKNKNKKAYAADDNNSKNNYNSEIH